LLGKIENTIVGINLLNNGFNKFKITKKINKNHFKMFKLNSAILKILFFGKQKSIGFFAFSVNFLLPVHILFSNTVIFKP